MNFIVYNHNNFEIVSPPLGGENSLPEARQNYLILILTQINVNCKFKYGITNQLLHVFTNNKKI